MELCITGYSYTKSDYLLKLYIKVFIAKKPTNYNYNLTLILIKHTYHWNVYPT